MLHDKNEKLTDKVGQMHHVFAINYKCITLISIQLKIWSIKDAVTLFRRFQYNTLHPNMLLVCKTTNLVAICLYNYWATMKKFWKHWHETEWLYFQEPIGSKREIEMVGFGERILLWLTKSTHQKQQIQIVPAEGYAKRWSQS